MNLGQSAEFNLANSGLRTNAKGGVLVTREELQNAFNFLDVDKQGKISISNMKKRYFKLLNLTIVFNGIIYILRRLSIFFPDLSTKELKFLMNNKRDLNIEDLATLLM
jgi:hypothetical protein